jgi:tetratricopeptide (TPR) repeat protein
VALWREIGDIGRLYDALTWTVAIGARHPERVDVRPFIEEGERIENPDWPGPLRSSFRWAKHRWFQSRGCPQEALVCAREQAELLAQTGCWAMHVAWGANVADCETSLGRPAEAATHARQALQALDAMGIDDNIVGHVMDALVVALVELGQVEEALPFARRARRLLEREGDELRLIEPLAQAAGVRGDWAMAARLAGHADAGIASRREQRWPSAQARWRRLQSRLAEHLPAFSLRELAREGAAMTRDEAFGLMLDATPPAPTPPTGVKPVVLT